MGVESILGRRLKARLAAEHSYQTGDPSGVLGVLEGQRCLDDPVALAEAISLAHHCLLGPDHAQQRLDLAHELLTAAALSARPIDLLMGLLWRTVDLFLLGDPTAERSLSELRSALTAGGHLACRFVLASLDGMLAVRAGRWADAEALVAKAADLGTAAGDADAVTWQAAQLFAIRWFQGRIPEMLSELTQLAASPSTGVIDRSSYAAVGLTLAVCADRAAAACALARVRGSGFDNLVRSSTWLVTMYGVVETAYLLDDLDTAAEAYGVLRAYAGLPMMTSLAVACYGSTEHSLGTAALTLGDTEAAVRHLRAAIRANQALGHHPAAALSTARLGHALMLRAGGEDAQRAAREGDSTSQAAASLGMLLPLRHPETIRQRAGAAAGVRLTRTDSGDWEVRLGQRVVTVLDCLGLRYLAILLDRRGEAVDACEMALLAASSGPGPVDRPQLPGVSRQPVIDERAKKDYRARVQDLTAQLEEHERMGDLGWAERARAERDWLLAELVSATGYAGRLRLFADDGERARIAVTKAIRRGLHRVAAADPVIGAELCRRVQTGRRCRITLL
ncbi:MAG TPA: hypothetical protein VES02_02770 [Dermatophilaceae bacterium]|nr:hypothetical protein [Dermatophilaceae bacterium]